jgi:glutamate racemase
MNRPIGLLDSGVGGLTVAREIFKFLPEERMIYFGDTLHLPYGPRFMGEVREFVYRIIDFLLEEKKAKIIVLACNTATAVALEEARERYSVPIFGTIDGARRKAIELSVNNKIGVIGTEGTINSQAYQRALLEADKHLEVFSAACPAFVDLVEEGKFDGTEVEEMAHKYLDGLKKAGIDILILGCTHFPYLMPVIQRIMGEGVKLINPAVEVAREVKEALNIFNLYKGGGAINKDLSQQEFLVSDKGKISELFLREGSKFLQLPSLSFSEINIFDKG